MSRINKTPELATEDVIVRGSIDAIESILPRFLANSSIKSTPESLQSGIEAYDEFLTSIKKLFNEKPLDQYQYLWLEGIYKLTHILYKLKLVFSNLYLHLQPHEIENIVNKAIPLATKLVYFTKELSQLVYQFFNNVGNIPVIFQNKVQDLIFQTFTLLLVDEIDDPSLANAYNAILQVIQLYLLSNSTNISLIVYFNEVIYKLGKSELIVPLLDTLDPEIPINMIINGSINLVDVMNYYRYVAFNLVTLSLLENSKKYNQLAEVYFRILLRFPNLGLNLYTIEDEDKSLKSDKRNEFIINLAERQELSLVYVLNYLLSLRSLRNLIDSPTLYKNELKFLVRSVSFCLSKDINELASQPGSTRSSMVSIPQYKMEVEKKVELERKFCDKGKFSSLGGTILYGSYKEKLKLVINFGEAFDTPNINLSNIYDRLNTHNLVDTNKVVEKLILAITKIVHSVCES
ncbi:hypothetical protein SBY92_001499 [Candida maltosa Xu316]